MKQIENVRDIMYALSQLKTLKKGNYLCKLSDDGLSILVSNDGKNFYKFLGDISLFIGATEYVSAPDWTDKLLSQSVLCIVDNAYPDMRYGKLVVIYSLSYSGVFTDSCGNTWKYARPATQKDIEGYLI